MFFIIVVPKSPRIVPGAALVESVGPRRSRTRAMAPGPARAMAMSGVEDMNCSTSGKKGFEAMWA